MPAVMITEAAYRQLQDIRWNEGIPTIAGVIYLLLDNYWEEYENEL